MQLIITGFKHINTSFNSHVHIQYSNRRKRSYVHFDDQNSEYFIMSYVNQSRALWMLPAQARPMLLVGGLKPNMVYI